MKKIVTEGSSLTTEYAGNYVYKNNNLEYFSTAEGYVTPENGSYKYVYQYKDHLGNIRLSYTDTDNNGTVEKSEIIEEKNYYPFGLTHKGYNGSVSSLGNSTAQLRGFGGKEEQNELGLGWIDITARNYDPALGRWMNLDPLAEAMRRHSPYNYAFDNPIYFIDPDGMMPFGNGEEPEEVYSGPGVAVGGNVVNELDEVVITGSKPATGSAQGAHVETTETGERFYGFKAEGQVEGEYGKINGSISGFSAGYDGSAGDGGAHGEASIYGLKADAGARLGTEDNNVAIEGEGSALSASISGDAGVYTGENDNYGFELSGEASAIGLKGGYTPSVTVAGLKIGFTVGASVGSAHIGGTAKSTYNSSTNEVEATGMVHAGLGAGFKLGFTITNTKQKIYDTRTKK